MILGIAIALLSGPLRCEAKWNTDKDLPFARVHGIAQVGSEAYVGGLKGLAKGRPGYWTSIDERPVKQLVQLGTQIWVLFGDGSVDKIDSSSGRLFFDVLNGTSKRPWTSCLTATPTGILLGGSGGWVERSQKSLEFFPKELNGEVVTALRNIEDSLWIGTQRKGLFEFRGGTIKRYGFAAGLPDSWVTASIFFDKHLILGMADGGLVKKSGEKFVPFDSPCRKVRLLISFDNKLVVGGMEGCWIQDGARWQQLSSEETTCLAIVKGKLAVGSPAGLLWWTK